MASSGASGSMAVRLPSSGGGDAAMAAAIQQKLGGARLLLELAEPELLPDFEVAAGRGPCSGEDVQQGFHCLQRRGDGGTGAEGEEMAIAGEQRRWRE